MGIANRRAGPIDAVKIANSKLNEVPLKFSTRTSKAHLLD
jgi:hypothetical protein